MTTVSDGLFQFGGVPVSSGLGIGPIGTGPRGKEQNVYYVNDDGGSDGDNDGLTPKRPFATIGQACVAVTARYTSGNYPWTDYWTRGDLVVIAPGLYEEALTAIPAGCSFLGMGNAFGGQNEYSKQNVLWKPTSTSGAITQSVLFGNNFHNIRFRSSGAGKLIEVEEIENVYFENCFFQGITDNTTHAIYIEDSWMYGGMKHCIISGCKRGLYIDYNVAMTYHTFHTVFIDDLTIMDADTVGIFHSTQSQSTNSYMKNIYIGRPGQSPQLPLGIDDNGVQKCPVANAHIWADANDPAVAATKFSGSYMNGILITT